MAEKKFPKWVTRYIAEWKQRLYLCEWTIMTVLSPHPHEDGSRSTSASVTLDTDTLEATIEFRDDIPETLAEVDAAIARDWKRIILHELLHIRLARLIVPIQNHVLSELVFQARTLIQDRLNNDEEQLIQVLSQTLIDLTEDG